MSELRAAAQDVHDLSRPPMRGHEWYCVPPELMAKLDAALAATASPAAVAREQRIEAARVHEDDPEARLPGPLIVNEAAVAVPLDDIDVERLARAMHPTWFEALPAAKPATLTPHEWGQMVLDVHLRRSNAMREATEIAAAYRDAKP